jgi:hypothetical protein
MKIAARYIGINALAAFAITGLAFPARATIVNIDATNYGYTTGSPLGPAPAIGGVVTPFALSGGLDQLTLGPGTYSIQNAAGMVGATPGFTSWRFNTAANFVWNFLIVDDFTKKVVYYAERGGLSSSPTWIAANPAVQNFSDTFSLASSTKLDFMIKDSNLSDNAGGVSLSVAAVPEPETYAMMMAGLGMMGFIVRRRKQQS